MATVDGHLRVLISTMAFGMSVNCKSVRRVVHFGPSKTVELYIQECGRAGRDGLPSTCVLLYNGLTATHCDVEMKKYLSLQDNGMCNRKWLMSHFGCADDPSSVGHECCGSCLKTCDCNDQNCGDTWSARSRNDEDELMLADEERHQAKFTRAVSHHEKRKLGAELRQLQKEMLNSVKVDTMVNCPNVILEFNSFQIKQVLEHCHHLFMLDDVYHFVEIWRAQYAVGILRVLNNVFGDIDNELLQKWDSVNQSVFSEWSQIREDSSLMDMLELHDSHDPDDFPMGSEEETSQESIHDSL